MPRAKRPNDLMVHVGLRLRALRELAGLEQQVFARTIGIEANTLSNYERGERFADPVAMTRMAQRFGWSLDFLYGGKLAGFRTFEEEERIIAICAQLGAALGAPTPEWPMQVESRPGEAGLRRPGAVPPLPRRPGGTIHEDGDTIR